MNDGEKKDVYSKFRSVVNMSANQIEKFLETENSKKVGLKKEGNDESVGHESGRKIIAILRKRRNELTDDDYAHMKKVYSYVSRHRAQGGPTTRDVTTSPWRYSLMNWGHDPCKGEG